MDTGIPIGRLSASRRLRSLLIMAVAAIACSPVGAQLDFEALHLSGDIDVRVPTAGGGSVYSNDRSEIILQADGTGDAQADPRLFDLAGVDVDAFDRSFRRRSIDTARIIEGVLVRPGDVFYFGVSGVIIDFDAAAAGVPDGVNLDAVTLDPDTGQLKVSFDRFFEHPSVSFVLPGDLITVVGGQLDSVAINGAALGDGVNLDAAHQLDTNNYLISVDVDAALPGGPGTLTVRDDDIVLYSIGGPRGVLGSFDPVFSLSEQSDPSWEAADLDALWAELAVNAGSFRFLVGLREVQEGSGTFTVSVERIDGSETAVAARVTSVNGSAIAGTDYLVVDEVLSWTDGDSGERSFTVTVFDDGLEEDPVETFSLQLAVESGEATLGAPATITVRILDNDGDNLFADGFEE